MHETHTSLFSFFVIFLTNFFFMGPICKFRPASCAVLYSEDWLLCKMHHLAEQHTKYNLCALKLPWWQQTETQ